MSENSGARLDRALGSLRVASVKAIARKKGWAPTDAELRAVCRTRHPIAEAVADLERIHGSLTRRLWFNAVGMVRSFRGEGGKPSG